MQNRRQWMERILGWLGLLMMVSLATWAVHHYMTVELWLRHAGSWGPIISVGLYALLSLTPIPSDPLTLLVFVLFGWSRGFVITWAGNTVAAMVEFGVAKSVGNLTDFGQHMQRLPVWLRKFPVNSPWFLILGRLIPGFGGKIVSVMAGLYEVPLGLYLWTTAVVNVVGSLLYMVGGWGIIQGLNDYSRWISHLREIF